MILPELGYGGAEKSFCSLSVELSKQYLVTIVVFSQGFDSAYPIGGDIISLKNKVAKSWLIKIINLFNRVKKLRKIKFNLNPYACISFLEGANYINILSAGAEKTIISVRGSKKFDQNINSSYAFIRKKVLTPFLYSRADSIVALSHGIKQELARTYPSLIPENIEVIYNSIDVERILKLTQEPLTNEWENYFHKNVVLVIASRLAEEKGIQLFLPIFRKLLTFEPQLKLLIIGDGHYLGILKEISNNLNIAYHQNLNGKPTSSAVQFLGFQANPFNWINKSSLFISSSIHEGFGNSILEAMACGVPVISSDCPYGPREILSDNIVNSSNLQYPIYANYGILLPNLRPDDKGQNAIWSDTILALLKDPIAHKKYSAKSIKRTQDFTTLKTVNAWEKLLSQ